MKVQFTISIILKNVKKKEEINSDNKKQKIEIQSFSSYLSLKKLKIIINDKLKKE